MYGLSAWVPIIFGLQVKACISCDGQVAFPSCLNTQSFRLKTRPAVLKRNLASQINARLGGWVAAMQVHFLHASGDQVIAEFEVGPQHLQAYGIVHGGVYSGVIESVASVGAALWARRYNQTVVGLENQTSFLVATREGKLTATALPLMRGRRTQVWQAKITNEKGETVAEGKVRLISLDQGAAIAGETVQLKSSDG